MSIFDRIRHADRPKQDDGEVRRGAVSGFSLRKTKARLVDWEVLRADIAAHLANTQMSLASHEHGYNLLIPGHNPIAFRPPHNGAVLHKPAHPFFYEETTTLLLSFLITRFQTSLFFDIGAGLGYFARVAASHIKHAPSVYAFEMRPDRMSQLEANIANDAFGARILPRLAGLTDVHKGPTDIWYASSILFETRPDAADYRERWRWLKFNLRSGFNGTFTSANVPMTSVDHVAETAGAWPDIVKVDVDGYEGRVLEGALKVLVTHRPFILLELHKDKKLRFGVRRRDIANSLFDLGYRALFLTDHQDRLKCEVVEVRSGDPLIDRQETDLLLFFHPEFQRNDQANPR